MAAFATADVNHSKARLAAMEPPGTHSSISCHMPPLTHCRRCMKAMVLKYEEQGEMEILGITM